jgi:hypothetical protein
MPLLVINLSRRVSFVHCDYTLFASAEADTGPTQHYNDEAFETSLVGVVMR